jgi:hypothetical protein
MCGPDDSPERTPLQIAQDDVRSAKHDVKYWQQTVKNSPSDEYYKSNLKDAKARLKAADKAIAKIRSDRAKKAAKRQLQTA